MLVIKENESKVLIVTLRDKASNQIAPCYTWRLTNKQSLENIVFYQTNSSTSPYFDAFTVSISPTYSDLTNGVIQSGHGQFTYEIYEMPSMGLTLSNAIQMIETGILIISPTHSPNIVSILDSNKPIRINNNQDRI
jgi:hypothetical protein